MTIIPDITPQELVTWVPPIADGPVRQVLLAPMLANVLDSLCEGKNNREIAHDWGISEDTVKTHLKRLYQALGVRDRTQTIVAVLTGGIEVRLKPGKNAPPRWSPNSPDLL